MAKWEELPITDRAQYMRVAVQNGYRDIRSIREAYNKYAEGGPKKVGPTYNPTTKTWTNSNGQDITGKSFKGKYGTTTYLDSGAVDLDTGVYDEKTESTHKYRYASNAPRVYIGGNTNEVRQKYFNTDTELSTAVKNMAKKYGISANVLASRMAKEGPIDEAVKHYNNTNGYKKRGFMSGPIWGLDDMGTWINEGIIKQPSNIKDLDTDYEMENEHGRTTWSVASNNYFDGVELTALALRHFKDKMRSAYPKASEDLLEQYATAAFNLGFAGANNLIKKGKIQNAYKPFINIKSEGGNIFENDIAYNRDMLLTKPNTYACGGRKKK